MILGNVSMGGGAIVLAALMAATVLFKWPNWLHYIWAAIALLWGLLAMSS